MKKSFVAFILTIAAIISCLVIPVSAAPNAVFEDVPENHWAKDYIYEMSSKGIVNGTGDGIFEPEAKVTTAQFATMLVRAFYADEIKANTNQYDTWYGSTMHIALDKGLLVMNPAYYTYEVDASGKEVWYTDHANADMTRTYMAIMIYNYLKENIKLDSKYGYDNWIATNIPYDVKELSEVAALSYADTMIGFVYQLGILTGTDDKGTFNGDGYMTRAQACAVISRTLNVVANSTKIDKCTDYGLLEYNKFHTEKRVMLANGKAPTPENITAVINGLRGTFVQGTSWTNDVNYAIQQKHETVNFSGCEALAYEVWEALYGYDVATAPFVKMVMRNTWYKDSFNKTNSGADYESMFDIVLPGDKVFGGGHVYVVVEVFDDYVTAVEGNYNGTINWDRKISRDTFNASCTQIERIIHYVQ